MFSVSRRPDAKMRLDQDRGGLLRVKPWKYIPGRLRSGVCERVVSCDERCIGMDCSVDSLQKKRAFLVLLCNRISVGELRAKSTSKWSNPTVQTEIV
jgi:hypothetical protein